MSKMIDRTDLNHLIGKVTDLDLTVNSIKNSLIKGLKQEAKTKINSKIDRLEATELISLKFDAEKGALLESSLQDLL